jgi:hypothetical protein
VVAISPLLRVVVWMSRFRDSGGAMGIASAGSTHIESFLVL